VSVEARVHDELLRRGGFQRCLEIANALDMDRKHITDALGRLKKRGAVELMGSRMTGQWRAVEFNVEDRRKYNGGARPKRGPDGKFAGAKPKPKKVKPHSAIHASSLTQALAWQP
jgi:hypothetical protein